MGQTFHLDLEPSGPANPGVFIAKLRQADSDVFATAEVRVPPSLQLLAKRLAEGMPALDSAPRLADAVRNASATLADMLPNDGSAFAELANRLAESMPGLDRAPQLADAVRNAGATLADMLPNDGSAFAELANRMQTTSGSRLLVHVPLGLREPDRTMLEHIPWTALDDQTRGHLTVVRSAASPATPLRVFRHRIAARSEAGQALRVLVVIGSLDQPNYQHVGASFARDAIQELQTGLKAAAVEGAQPRIAVRIVAPKRQLEQLNVPGLGAIELNGREQLRDILRGVEGVEGVRGFDVVHFVGHSNATSSSPATRLLCGFIPLVGSVLSHPPEDCLDASDLAADLGAPAVQDRTVLCVFENCNVGGTMLAPLLAVVDHAVGTQGLIAAQLGSIWTKAFYRHLAGFRPVGEALREARRAIHGSDITELRDCWWQLTHWMACDLDQPFGTEEGYVLREFALNTQRILHHLEDAFEMRELRRIAIPLAINTVGDDHGGDALRAWFSDRPSVTLQALVARGGAYFLFGEPDSGKTGSLRHATQELLDQLRLASTHTATTEDTDPPKIPVYVDLRTWGSSDPRASLDSLIESSLIWCDLPAQVHKGIVSLLLAQRRRLVVLLDHWDWIPGARGNDATNLALAKVLVRNLVTPSRTDPVHTLLIACRTEALPEELTALPRLRLMPLDPDRQAELLERWLRPGHDSTAESWDKARHIVDALKTQSESVQQAASIPRLLGKLGQLVSQPGADPSHPLATIQQWHAWCEQQRSGPAPASRGVGIETPPEPRADPQGDPDRFFDTLRAAVRAKFDDSVPLDAFYRTALRDRFADRNTPRPESVRLVRIDDRGSPDQILSLDHVLALSRRSLIIGPPGSGKSTLIYTAAHHVTQQGLRTRDGHKRDALPIVLNLQSFDTSAARFEQSAKWLAEIAGVQSPSAQWIEATRQHLLRWAHEGKLALLLDALDEGDLEDVSRRISGTASDIGQWQSPMVVTLRDNRFDRSVASRDRGLGIYEIRQLERGLVRAYVDKFADLDQAAREKIADHPLAKSWLGVQLLVYDAVDANEVDDSDLPYRVCFRLIDSWLQTMHEKPVGINARSATEGLVWVAGRAAELRRMNRPLRMREVQVVLRRFLNSQKMSLLVQHSARPKVIAELVSIYQQTRLLLASPGDSVRLLHSTLAVSLERKCPETAAVRPSDFVDASPREVLSEVRDFQGGMIPRKRSSRASAQYDAALRNALLKSTFFPGGWDLSSLELEPYKRDSSVWVAVAARIQGIVLRYRTARDHDELLGLEDGLRALHEVVDDLGRAATHAGSTLFIKDLSEQIFIEYLLGLAYFELLSSVGSMFLRSKQRKLAMATRLGRPATGGMGYADGLRETFVHHGQVLEGINGIYGKGRAQRDPKEAWLDAMAMLAALPPTLMAQIEGAISLRFFPSDRAGVSLAQILHWRGWGGRNEVLMAVRRHLDQEGAKKRGLATALLCVLCDHLNHAFDWFRESKAGMDYHFKERFELFAWAAAPLKEYATRCAAALTLSSPERAHWSEIRIWGDAVGPLAQAEVRIAMAVRMLHETHRQSDWPSTAWPIHATLTDVSAPALLSLYEAWDAVRGKSLGDQASSLDRSTSEETQRNADALSVFADCRILSRDLNQAFQLEPSAREDPTRVEVGSDAFDIYSCSVALHQICDRRLGFDRLKEIMGFACRAVRPGGVISIPDVGVGVALQVVFLPINSVDREGGYGLDVFTKTKRRSERLRFRDVACPGPTAGRLKLPLPLVALAHGTPPELAEVGYAMYETVPYSVIELDPAQLDALQESWDSAENPEEFVQLAQNALEQWKQGASEWVPKAKAMLEEPLGAKIYDLVNSAPPRVS